MLVEFTQFRGSLFSRGALGNRVSAAIRAISGLRGASRDVEPVHSRAAVSSSLIEEKGARLTLSQQSSLRRVPDVLGMLDA